MNSRWRTIAMAVLALAASAFLPAVSRGADPVAELKFSEFFINDFSNEFSDKLKSLAGKPVAVRGFLAPPLKADAKFVVLTRDPVALCQFCDSDESWPQDIMVVYLRDVRIELGSKIRMSGVLDIGSKTDANTGFVSQIRLVNAEMVR